MKTNVLTTTGLILISISQLLMSLGYDFLMAQRPIDYAHWSLLLGAIMLLSLWSSLPASYLKNIGLTIMTIGLGGIIGMCTLDFLLWASHESPNVKQDIYNIIFSTPSLKLPFMIIGPALFYSGICISIYTLFVNYKWQVLLVNIGALMIGLGHMILHNQLIPVMGSVLLFIGIVSIIYHPSSVKNQ